MRSGALDELLAASGIPDYGWNAISGFFGVFLPAWGFIPSKVMTYLKPEQKNLWFALFSVSKIGWEAYQWFNGDVAPNADNLANSLEQIGAAVIGSSCGAYGFRDSWESLKSAPSYLEDKIHKLYNKRDA